jgi:hypothetical protein
MSEGSRHLQVAIAGILGIIIVRNSIDERIPTCMLAVPPKAVAMATCPLQHPMLHSHDELSALLPRVGQLTGLSHGVSMAYGELINATPILASAAECPAKEQAPLHLERKDAAPPEEMPILLRNSAANFMNSQYVPQRRDLFQADPPNNIIVLNRPSCPDKDQAPLHLERKDGREITGSGDLIADASIIEGSDSMLPSFVTARPQFVENPAPAFIPAARSNLVTVLTQYPEAPKIA